MWQQYCGYDDRHNRITPQLWCDVTASRYNITASGRKANESDHIWTALGRVEFKNVILITK
ncbi:hypothetical protein Lalb_Chr05g0229261 [Lupinus albus]|uniref:Uncharacterized protein n=1 Tax=Lupinus albus TaxID=3870 RepID=A0A6A4QKP8_LUPAL|nr:hypothetical protein Lalb_Chr05g0229261 [Lupinus albus]